MSVNLEKLSIAKESLEIIDVIFLRSHVSLFLPFADGEVTHPLEINCVTLIGTRLLYAMICSIKTLT